MAHDKHALHVSHYQDSHTWRSAVAPADRSWLLFIDAANGPHLYIEVETRDAEGHTVSTYAPTGGAAKDALAGVAAVSGLRIIVGPADEGSIHAFTAATDDAAGGGATQRDAVIALFDYIDQRDWKRRGEEPVPDPAEPGESAALAL